MVCGASVVSRYRRRVDGNQKRVVGELRQLGCYVEPGLSRVGHGVPDLLVGYKGRWHVVELKDPDQPPSKQVLSPDEKVWHEKAGPFAHVIIATTTEEIMERIR